MPLSRIPVPQGEWLEPDGLGGFASGTTLGFRTRRYHSLLLAAATPPADRRVLVQSVSLRLSYDGAARELWPEVYAGDVVTGPALSEADFTHDPWPTYRQTVFGCEVVIELFVPHGYPAVVLAVRLETALPGARLELRPLLSGRDFHALQRENGAFRFEPRRDERCLTFVPYADVPGVTMLANAEYRHAPDWYRRFHYMEEAERGLDSIEDLASPGVFSFDFDAGEAVLLMSAELPGALPLARAEPLRLTDELRRQELERRSAFAGPLERAADAYVVPRGAGSTILAGYPWFGDWGRDTFIAIRGLCFALGRFDAAREILVAWAGVVSEGMLPNRFPDRADAAPEYNSVDAALWYVLAASELIAHDRLSGALSDAQRRALETAILEIADGYARGTRHGIRRDGDGLLAAGEPGTQLTWMDAKVGERVITPRIGKPVEIQALWIHALSAAAERDGRFRGMAEQAQRSFEDRFWNPDRQMLYDVVDENHVRGAVDPSCRPNQILAAGGLPLCMISEGRARLVVDAVERELWTPLGLRSLERGHPAYTPRYVGGVAGRDSAYHQGTAWPWLLGPFVEAWVKTRGATTAAKREARNRFVIPLLHHVQRAGIDHVSEIADGDPPYTPRGCPFQAWSVGELLRLEREVLI